VNAFDWEQPLLHLFLLSLSLRSCRRESINIIHSCCILSFLGLLLKVLFQMKLVPHLLLLLEFDLLDVEQIVHEDFLDRIMFHQIFGIFLLFFDYIVFGLSVHFGLYCWLGRREESRGLILIEEIVPVYTC
jgi:hypothetical protein